MINNQRAIADFDKALQFDPRNVLAYRNRGIVRGELGDRKGAIADFQKALEIDPNSSMTYISRGNALRDMGNYGLAIKDYNKALEIAPKDAKAYYNRGIAYSRLEEMKKAIADYENAVKLFGDKGDWKNYHKTLERLNKIQSFSVKKEEKTDPNVEKNRLREKLLRMVGGYWEIAERLIEQARQKFPGMSEEWYWEKVIADIERDRGNF
ncbi:MAG: tetratricopeptide repeat protein [Okeania sp. SIO2H7]|nr:tetratricopeptide repeat protein [Okeania sp. SIO2H7]